MNQQTLETALASLPLGRVKYFSSVGSTNDVAARWINEGTPHLSLIVANEQITGRGRSGRPWLTPAGAALAFSLVLHPPREIEKAPFTALGTLAVCLALETNWGLTPQIKWPNDVLLAGKKVCGVLAEAHWSGDTLQGLVVGIGINIAPSSVPPDDRLQFPATCVQNEAEQVIDRLAFLRDVLGHLITWEPKTGSPAFLEAWETRLAYLGKQVRITSSRQPPLEGLVQGLEADGKLRLRLEDGTQTSVHAGEVHLRPLVDSS